MSSCEGLQVSERPLGQESQVVCWKKGYIYCVLYYKSEHNNVVCFYENEATEKLACKNIDILWYVAKTRFGKYSTY